MLRTIDKINDTLIQKITKPDGTVICYQVIHKDMVGKGSAIEFKRLGEAREYCGFARQQQAAE